MREPTFGDIFKIDLTAHTSPSTHTMSGYHPVLVVQDEELFSPGYPNVIIVPGTSLKKNSKLWNKETQTLTYQTHYLLRKDKYRELTYDTIIKCEQVFTLEKSFLEKGKYICKVDLEDMNEIITKITMVLGATRF